MLIPQNADSVYVSTYMALDLTRRLHQAGHYSWVYHDTCHVCDSHLFEGLISIIQRSINPILNLVGQVWTSAINLNYQPSLLNFPIEPLYCYKTTPTPSDRRSSSSGSVPVTEAQFSEWVQGSGGLILVSPVWLQEVTPTFNIQYNTVPSEFRSHNWDHIWRMPYSGLCITICGEK